MLFIQFKFKGGETMKLKYRTNTGKVYKIKLWKAARFASIAGFIIGVAYR